MAADPPDGESSASTSTFEEEWNKFLDGLRKAKDIPKQVLDYLDEQDRQLKEGVRQYSMDVAGSAGREVAREFIKEARVFIKDDVGPLLDRMETIATGRIERMVGEANKILIYLEQILGQLLADASGKIDQTITRIDKLIKATGIEVEAKIGLFFDGFRAEINKTIGKLDQMLKTFICAAMNGGDGLYIQGLPFGKREDSITVWFPSEKQCFAKYSKSATSMFYAEFSGFEYYEGMMCELEFDMQELDPSDSLTIPRMSSYYRELAVLAARAACKDNITKVNMIALQMQYEKKAFFYDSLANGTWPLLRRSRK
ncbi:MAG TPA: hypothetical protein VE093_42170 [Polyangiaceae bacterium]|nr:hypothetical protein [Polyangiaceae bacterium]